jgi:hypothetical protein
VIGTLIFSGRNKTSYSACRGDASIVVVVRRRVIVLEVQQRLLRQSLRASQYTWPWSVFFLHRHQVWKSSDSSGSSGGIGLDQTPSSFVASRLVSPLDSSIVGDSRTWRLLLMVPITARSTNTNPPRHIISTFLGWYFVLLRLVRGRRRGRATERKSSPLPLLLLDFVRAKFFLFALF